MSMTRSVRFGNVEIRPLERQVLIDGQAIVIGARAFDVLNVLITHHVRVVSKAELLAAVWPGLVVEENNIQVQISTLRKLLGSNTISTIAGVGYQFTAELDNDLELIPLVPRTEPPPPTARHSASGVGGSTGRAASVAIVILAVVAVILGIYLRMKPDAAAPAHSNPTPALPHSVAVLPFANLSGDANQDYFSDGLSEEVLDSLSSIPDLHVAARISSFTFKNKGGLIADIGRKLNVGTVLEGSVRKEGQHVRINVQLVDVATGYDLWSQSYDRDIANIFALQTEIATAVTNALQATLLPNAGAVIEMGGTQNTQAFEAYLKGETLEGRIDEDSISTRIAEYEEAIRQDPNFAKAYVGQAAALELFGGSIAASPNVHEYYERARASAEKALALEPELGRAHSVLAQILLYGYFDFSQSLAENDRALALSPGDTFVLRRSVPLLALVGRTELAVLNAQRAVTLDPINGLSYMALGFARYHAHQYPEAIEAFNRASSIHAELTDATAFRGLSYRRLGRLEAAADSCRKPPITTNNLVCLAMVYHEQGRIPEAGAALTKITRTLGEAAAMQYVEIYAQWNDMPAALSWLDTAYRLRDVGLASMKTNELFDPLRSESRFQAIERELSFPN